MPPASRARCSNFQAGLDSIDYGLSILRRDAVLTEFARGAKGDLATLMNKLSIAGQLRAHEVHERFYEIGSPDGLDDFVAYVGIQAGQANSDTN